MIKEKRRKKRRLKVAVRVILILVLLALTGFLIVRNLFKITKVNVEGNELYDSSTIQSVVLDDKYSWNTLYVVLKYKFGKNEDIPFVDQVSVKMNNPHTITIKVYEKGMLGYIYIPSLNQNAYFDKDGFVIEISSDAVEDVPEIKGIDCQEVVLCEKLPIDDDSLKDILNLTQDLKRNDLVPDSIKYGVDNEPVLVYDNLKVEVGDTDLLTQKVACLEAVMSTVKNKSGTLHLENWTEESTNIVFDPD